MTRAGGTTERACYFRWAFPEGHYAGSPGVEKEFIYVVQPDAAQEALSSSRHAPPCRPLRIDSSPKEKVQDRAHARSGEPKAASPPEGN